MQQHFHQVTAKYSDPKQQKTNVLLHEFLTESTYYLFTNSLTMAFTNTTDALLIRVFQLSQLCFLFMQPLIL